MSIINVVCEVYVIMCIMYVVFVAFIFFNYVVKFEDLKLKIKCNFYTLFSF